jgi:hypothetical protein
VPSVSIGFCVAITTKGFGTVDFVGQHKIGEDRPQHGGKVAAFLVVDARAGEVRRHQVGRELNALETARHRLGQGGDGKRLGQARHAFHQEVAARQQRDQHAFQEMILAHHDLFHFIEKMFQTRMRAVGHAITLVCLAVLLKLLERPLHNGFSPTALAAFSIGTAKPMPAKTRWPVGL